jgi:hypothetical protein
MVERILNILFTINITDDCLKMHLFLILFLSTDYLNRKNSSRQLLIVE